MKKLFYVSVMLLAFAACKNNPEKETVEEVVETQQVPDMHTSQIALDWQGVYKGVLPCADCEGIETEVTLNADGTYVITRLYLGKDEATFEETGTFKWTEDGGSIVLKEKIKDSPTLFKVGENFLLHLNQEGNSIEGELADRYVLHKI
ncbi:MAG TPA: copper resistance protein NlpE [Flavobacteriaceae bacterium]|nr:copper resistance protein NlpE [Flavobacteriaceae bacterium]